MKKIVALLLVAMLSLSFAVTGFASADEQPDFNLNYGKPNDGEKVYMVPKSTVKIMLGVWLDPTAELTPDELDICLDVYDDDVLSVKTVYADSAAASAAIVGKDRAALINALAAVAIGVVPADKVATITDDEVQKLVDAQQLVGPAAAMNEWEAYYYTEPYYNKWIASDMIRTIITPVAAARAYDDGYLKFSPKITKGAEFVDAITIKKSGTKELYLEVKTKENYFGGLKDVQIETKVTFTKPAKIREGKTTNPPDATYYYGASPIALERLGGIENNDYFYDTRDYKYGWGPEYDLSAASADHSFSSSSPANYEKPSGDYRQYLITNLMVAPGYDAPEFSKEGGSGSKRIHFKKGDGEIYDFDFDSAYFEVKLEDNAAFNLYYTGAALKEVISAYPDADFQFFCFKGQPAFDFTASVELYTDEDEVGEEPYLYIWDGATLTPVKNEFEDGTFYVKTRQLGNYVVSSEELEIKAVATTAEAPATTAPSTPSTANPATGVADFVGVAVALALVSVAAAGAVALKK